MLTRRIAAGLSILLLPLGLQAALVPTAPADYATVPLLSSGMKAWKTKTFAEQKSASTSADTTARKNTEKDYAANALLVRISWSGGAAPYVVRVGSRIDGLFYRVVTTTALGGEWTPVTEFLPVADFTVDRVKTDSAAFYRIEVSDVKCKSEVSNVR